MHTDVQVSNAALKNLISKAHVVELTFQIAGREAGSRAESYECKCDDAGGLHDSIESVFFFFEVQTSRCSRDSDCAPRAATEPS
jgi:hypothetical protein